MASRRARRRAHLADLWRILTIEERTEFLGAVRVLETFSNRLKTLTPNENNAPTVEETLSRLT